MRMHAKFCCHTSCRFGGDSPQTLKATLNYYIDYVTLQEVMEALWIVTESYGALMERCGTVMEYIDFAHH